MDLHIAQMTVDSLGRIVISDLPFKPGEKVEVIVRSQVAPPERADLCGSVLRYDSPFDSVAAEDWEVRF